MIYQNKTDFLNSLVKKEDKAKESLIYLYQEVRKTNEFLGLKNSLELKTTYFNLRKEEVGELFKAIEQQDRVEFLDAVVDGLVVVGYEYYLNDQKPEVSVPFLDIDFNIEGAVSEIQEFYDRDLCYEETLGLIEDIFLQLNINHMRAAEEVIDSNMSKFPTVDELLEVIDELVDAPSWWTNEEYFKHQEWLITSKGRYTGVYHEIRKDVEGNDRIIWWATGENKPDGSHLEYKSPKCVKPCTFKNPDFKSCWLD